MNLVALLGRTTKDLELKYSQSGTAVVKFTLAVNRAYKKQGEERQTDFISCIAFGKTAETLGKYVDKGRQIAIQGKIQTGSYVKDDGTKVYTTDIVVDSFFFADSKQGGQANQQASYQSPPQPTFNNGEFMPIDGDEYDDGLPF
jgi:single-strand DNA-binding protein